MSPLFSGYSPPLKNSSITEHLPARTVLILLFSSTEGVGGCSVGCVRWDSKAERNSLSTGSWFVNQKQVRFVPQSSSSIPGRDTKYWTSSLRLAWESGISSISKGSPVPKPWDGKTGALDASKPGALLLDALSGSVRRDTSNGLFSLVLDRIGDVEMLVDLVFWSWLG